MPIIRVELFPGRSPEVKRELAREIVELFDRVAGARANATTVIFTEIKPEDWISGTSFVIPDAPLRTP